MWLIQQFGSLLNLGICKEYSYMAKEKSPRTGNNRPTKKQVISMPEAGTHTSELSSSLDKKHSVVPIDLESEIRRRAYELYEQRGCVAGFDRDDWLVAEREVRARYSRQQ